MTRLKNIKEKEGSIKKLQNLFSNEDKKLYGVGYDNTFLTTRFIARVAATVQDYGYEDGFLKMTIPVRAEYTGIVELDNIIRMLEHTGSIGTTKELDFDKIPQEFPFKGSPFYTVDLFLNMDKPEITYKEFTVAGEKFTLVKIKEVIPDNYESETEAEEEIGEDVELEIVQEVTLLFGNKGEAFFISHLNNKNLSVRDTRIALDLMLNENLIGQSIVGIAHNTEATNSFYYPTSGMIYAYKNISGTYIFNAASSAIKIKDPENFKSSVNLLDKKTGLYELVLDTNREEIRIQLE